MAKMVFINLAVADLPKAKAFYEAIGFTNNPAFTDDTAACMVWSDTIYAMLLTHDKWRSFTQRPMGTGEVMLALSADSREDVDRLVDAAATAGGSADPGAVQDHGFMYGRSLLDPDGHYWEGFWMDRAAMESQPSPAAQEVHDRTT
jgi:predicted lactoylglutathione lyase